MDISKQTRERFAEWMKTHEPHDVFSLGGKDYPGDQVAELMGVDWPVTKVSDADYINIDIEATDEDLGPSHDSGDPEEY